MAFQPINFAGINPQVASTGFASGANTLATELQNKRQRELQEKLAQERMAQQMALAKMRMSAEAPLQQARLELLKAQTQRAMQPQAAPMGPLAKALADRQMIYSQYPEGSRERQLADQYMQKITQSSQGITVIDPKTGQPMVQIGGRATGRSGAGLYQSGEETVSMPTTPTVTQLQKTLSSSPRIQDALNTAKEYGDFLAPKKRAETYAEGLANRYLGAQYETPSRKQYLEGRLKLAAESVIRELGLNPTDRNIMEVTDILMPHSGESGKGFAKRMQNSLLDFAKNDLMAKKILTEGFRAKRSEQQSSLTYNPKTGSFE